MATPAVPHENPDGKFLYFAFGSNLYDQRIRLNCPSAERVGPGKLVGYRLAFNYNSLRWRGHVATIEDSEGEHLWGCIWVICNTELAALDFQEGVHIGLYRPLQVDVTSLDGQTLSVRTYQMTLPYEENARPSVVYKRVVATGARQSGLPQDYLEHIDRIEDNGYDGPVEVECNLVYRQDAITPQFHVNTVEFPPVDEPERILPVIRRASDVVA